MSTRRSRSQAKADSKSTEVRQQHLGPEDPCPACGGKLSPSERCCRTCKYDAGAPNVRECGTPAERKALKERLARAEQEARRKKCDQEFNNLSNTLKERSGVVVAMPASVARSLVSRPGEAYVGYETLVGSGVRSAALPSDDRHRSAIVGVLFGTYGRELTYGVLSLDESGLGTYGEICCRLRPVAIQHRTSFLEYNSYAFVDRHGLKPGSSVPCGFRAVWDNRHHLALAKLTPLLHSQQGLAEWQRLLVKTDGINRQNDDFVEAHIYESFDVAAVETMLTTPGKRLSKEQKLDARIAIDLFKKQLPRAKTK
jgi:hypothetical protein